MASSTAQRSLNHARKLGFTAEVVEKWISIQPNDWKARYEQLLEKLQRIAITPSPPTTPLGTLTLPQAALLAEQKIPTKPEYPGGGVRKDLHGCIDIYACKIGLLGGLGIQSCAASGLAAHRAKAIASEKLPFFLWGNSFEIWAWAKRGQAGKRKLYQVKRWRLITISPEIWEEVDADHTGG